MGAKRCFVGAAVVLTALSGWAQQSNQVAVADNPATANDSAAPLTLTLQDALARARANEPQYRAALTDYGVARQNTVQARAGLLPNVSYTGQFLYTQGNGTSTGRFIGANGVHEYISEGNVHQSLSLQDAAEYRRARAEEALAKAQSEIAARGLVVTVVQAYYGLVVAQRKYATAQRAADEASHFFDLTQKRERGGEVAHSDSIKAELQQQQQQRSLRDAELEMERSRLDLAVMIFPNFNENFPTVDDLENVEALPSYQEVEVAAGENNPQLRVALASLKAANQEVAVAWNGFLPSLSLDYFYGIDANHYAVNGYRSGDRTECKESGLRGHGNAGASSLELGSEPQQGQGGGLAARPGESRIEFRAAQGGGGFEDVLRRGGDFAYGTGIAAAVGGPGGGEPAPDDLRYQAGEATVLEVVDAQNTLTLSQNALGDGQQRFRVAVANLQTLTGKF